MAAVLCEANSDCSSESGGADFTSDNDDCCEWQSSAKLSCDQGSDTVVKRHSSD